MLRLSANPTFSSHFEERPPGIDQDLHTNRFAKSNYPKFGQYFTHKLKDNRSIRRRTNSWLVSLQTGQLTSWTIQMSNFSD